MFTSSYITFHCLQESLVAEGEFDELRGEAQRKYDQSIVDRQNALDIQNRTAVLQRLTQDQLLQVESKHACTTHMHALQQLQQNACGLYSLGLLGA